MNAELSDYMKINHGVASIAAYAVLVAVCRGSLQVVRSCILQSRSIAERFTQGRMRYDTISPRLIVIHHSRPEPFA